MKVNFIKNIDGGIAKMDIMSEIGGNGIDGQMFANQMRSLNERSDVDEIEVLINSPGGSVIDGFSIFSAIRDSSKPVTTFATGVAASIAGIILLAGDRIKINDFGSIMIHSPSDSEHEDDEETKKAVKAMRDQLLIILTNRTGLKKERIEKMMNEVTWLNAKQAKNFGFVDEIISTARKIKNIAAMGDASAADLHRKYTEILNQIDPDEPVPVPVPGPKSTIKMKNIKNTLKLDESVDETVVNDKVKEVVNEVKTLKGDVKDKDEEIEKLKKANVEMQEKVSSVEDKAAIDYVENAIKEGKLKKDDKEKMLEKAKEDFEGFKEIVDAFVPTVGSINNMIDKSGKEVPATEFGKFEGGKLDGKSLRELEKEDETKVSEIMNKAPELYNALYIAEYKVEEGPLEVAE